MSTHECVYVRHSLQNVWQCTAIIGQLYERENKSFALFPCKSVVFFYDVTPTALAYLVAGDGTR